MNEEAPPTESACCVIPCFNVAAYCGEVVRAVSALGYATWAVDDGSTDETRAVLLRAAAGRTRAEGIVRVIELDRNGGKGAAIIAGFRAALREGGFDNLVTLDGDLQHRPEDIPLLVARSRTTGAPLVIGERTLRAGPAAPLRSRLGNRMATALLKSRFPNAPQDTQSGFRALRRDFVEEVVEKVPPGRYETEIRMLMLALSRGGAIPSVPIRSLYLDGNRSSSFRPISDAIRVARAVLSWPR